MLHLYNSNGSASAPINIAANKENPRYRAAETLAHLPEGFDGCDEDAPPPAPLVGSMPAPSFLSSDMPALSLGVSSFEDQFGRSGLRARRMIARGPFGNEPRATTTTLSPRPGDALRGGDPFKSSTDMGDDGSGYGNGDDNDSVGAFLGIEATEENGGRHSAMSTSLPSGARMMRAQRDWRQPLQHHSSGSENDSSEEDATIPFPGAPQSMMGGNGFSGGATVERRNRSRSRSGTLPKVLSSSLLGYDEEEQMQVQGGEEEVPPEECHNGTEGNGASETVGGLLPPPPSTNSGLSIAMPQPAVSPRGLLDGNIPKLPQSLSGQRQGSGRCSPLSVRRNSLEQVSDISAQVSPASQSLTALSILSSSLPGSLSESDSNVKSTFFSKQNMSTMPPASGTSGRNNGTSSINRNDRSDNSNTVNIRRGVPEYGSSSNNRYGNCQDPIVNMIDDARGMSIHGSNNQRTGFSMTTSSPPGSPMRSKMSLSDSAEWQQLEQQLQNGDDQDPFEMDT